MHLLALPVGPTAGGTVVTIHGIGFTASATYGSWCRWEHIAVVPARVLHAQVVTCVAPSSPEPRRVQVTLQLNNVLTRTSASFRFVAVPTVNFYPLLGPVEGGTQLLLDGTLMIAADWWCRFDQIVVPARRATSTRLQVLKMKSRPTRIRALLTFATSVAVPPAACSVHLSTTQLGVRTSGREFESPRFHPRRCAVRVCALS